MRLQNPTMAWIEKWQKAHKAAGGWDGSATMAALKKRATELYRAGASAAAAGMATAREHDLHSGREFWAESTQGADADLKAALQVLRAHGLMAEYKKAGGVITEA